MIQTAPGHTTAYRRTINQESGRSEGRTCSVDLRQNGSR